MDSVRDKEFKVPGSREEGYELWKRLKKEREELEEKIETYRRDNLIEFFKPIDPYQSKILEYIHSGKKVVTLQGANQIGKTTLGAVVVGSACLGIQPWDRRETVWGRRAVRVRILCQNWEHHVAEVVVPELKKWLPRGFYDTKKNMQGFEAYWRFGNGSTIEILTNKMDTSDHEGWKGDLVWADEPLPYDKFIANKRGLIANNGVFLLTMTAVSESWILDDIVLNPDPGYASVTEVPIEANPYLTEDGIRSFSASLREEDKIARIYGKWLNLEGLVWKEFKPDIHIIESFKVPLDWPVVAMIDWHTKEPIAVGFYAVDNRNIVYVVDEMWQNGSAEQIADEIIRRKRAMSWRMTEAFIDPLSKGDTAYIKNMGVDVVKDSFSRLRDRLWMEGIELKVASKDKDSGIRNVQDMLKGVNGLPSLFFFRSLPVKKESHIFEIQRWTYGDNGKPRDDSDHFMENLYRFTLTGVKYIPPRRHTEDLRSEIDFNIFGGPYAVAS